MRVCSRPVLQQRQKDQQCRGSIGDRFMLLTTEDFPACVKVRLMGGDGGNSLSLSLTHSLSPSSLEETTRRRRKGEGHHRGNGATEGNNDDWIDA